MTTLLVVPVIDPDYSLGCLDSIHPSLHRQLLVVDNCARPLGWRPRHVTIHRARHNLGVARSWNLGIETARLMGHDAVAFISAQVRFGEAGARDLAALDPGPWGTLPAPTYWHTAIFSLALFDAIGLVDENFHPGYYEECDVHRRWLLAGLDVTDHLDPPIDATAARDGHGVDQLREDFPRQTTINYDALADYWHAKWGCHVDDRADLSAGYATPFGRDVPLPWWEPCSVEELWARYGIVGR